MPQAESTAAVVVTNAKLVLDCLPRAVVIIDRAGTIIAWNAVATQFYGWTADEAIGRSVFDLIILQGQLDAAHGVLEDVVGGAQWDGAINLQHKQGDVVPTLCFVGPLRDADGTVVGAVAAADDRRKVNELVERARHLNDRLVLALSAGRLGTWQWDKQTGTVAWDPMMEELFGFDPGTFGGTYDEYVNALPPDERDAVLATLERALEDKRDYEVEHRVTLRDGTTRWLQGRGKVTLDSDGNVTGTIGCVIDVTERKLAEGNAARRLREAEAAASRERRQRERLEFLTKLNDQALSATDETELMNAVATAAVPHLGDWCAVYFVPEPGVPPAVVIAHADPDKVAWAHDLLQRVPFDPASPVGAPAAIRSGRTEFVEAVDPAQLHRQIDESGRPDREELHAVVDQLSITSRITVPLITRRGVVGAIQFVTAESGRRYDADDVALAEAAAGRVGEGLVNSWLMHQQRDIAVTLQAALLPSALPEIPGVSVAVRYWAAGALAEVGGDFYDVFPVGPDRWAIVIGDVCGTGPRAAAVTSIARYTIRAAATHGHQHGEVLEWVNAAIRASDRDTFCTLIYSTLERDEAGGWRYTYALGGHPRPVVIHAEGPSEAIGTHGTLIGLIDTIDTTTESVSLLAGDALVLYTDGVTDLHPPNGMDEAQLVAMVDAARDDGGAEAVAARLGTAIETQVPIGERRDDVALLVLSIAGRAGAVNPSDGSRPAR